MVDFHASQSAGQLHSRHFSMAPTRGGVYPPLSLLTVIWKEFFSFLLA